jgi:hypothetical protein
MQEGGGATDFALMTRRAMQQNREWFPEELHAAIGC